MSAKSTDRPSTAPKLRRPSHRRRSRGPLLWRTGLAALGVLALLFVVFQLGGGGSGGASGPRFDVGSPGPGAQAPEIRLPSTAGGTYDLSQARGTTVLLYFQEGLMCQPCWNQITAIEKDMAEFKVLGIDELVSITSDPMRLLRQKVADEGIRSPVLADEDLSLAKSYEANQYGMMGTSRYGHSFIVVGPDGRIRWRGDYGGAPDFTMFVGVPDLLDDLRAGMAASG